MRNHLRIMGGVLLGYSFEEIDLERATHCGRAVKRSPVESYLLSNLKILISHSPDFKTANLGARAYGKALNKLIEKRFGRPILYGRDSVFYGYTLSDFSHDDGEDERRFIESVESVVSRKEEILQELYQLKRSMFGRIALDIAQAIEIRRNNKKGSLVLRGLRKVVSRPVLERNRIHMLRFEELTRADLAIVNGNGTFCDMFKEYAFRTLFEIYCLKKMGKKVFLVNFTFDFKDSFLLDVSRRVLDVIDYIAVREMESLDAIRAIGIHKPIVLSADLAFLLSPTKEDRFNGKCFFKETGLKKGAFALALRCDMNHDPHNWARIVRELSKFGKDIAFASSSTSDVQLAKEIAKKAPLKIIKATYSPEELISLYSNFDLVIADRYHANIFALMGNTPIVPIQSNSAKVKGLLRFLDDYPVEVIDNRDANSSDIVVSNSEQVLRQRERIKLSLTPILNRLRCLAEKNLPSNTDSQ